MFIRALMTKESKIFILPLFFTTKNFINIKNIIANLETLNDNMKGVYVLDVKANQDYYEEVLCHIVK